MKRCSENMQQMCWRTHMPKCEHLEGCFWSQQISQVILINRFYKNILISQYRHSQPGIFCIDFESFVRILTSCCCGYHYCTTSFKQILNSGSGHGQTGDSRRWGSLITVPAGNKAKRLSLVNHTTKAVHHHHHHHHHRQSFLLYFYIV